MGSGINFFTNAIDVTPGTTGSWQNIDCSANIPAGSVGVVVEVINQSSGFKDWGVRHPDSSDERYKRVGADAHCYAMIGVNGSRVFEAKIATADVRLMLIGYFDDNCGFFTNGIDKSLTTTEAWTDIDVSGDGVPSGATGAIFEVVNTSIISTYEFGFRKKGSSDDWHYNLATYFHQFIIVGLDATRKCQGYIENASVDFYLVGYVKSPVVMLTNAADISEGSLFNQWVEKDVTSETSASADGVIVQIRNLNASYCKAGGIRHADSTDDFPGSNYADLYANHHIWALCGLKSGQLLDIFAESADVDHQVIGYCAPVAVEAGPRSFGVIIG